MPCVLPNHHKTVIFFYYLVISLPPYGRRGQFLLVQAQHFQCGKHVYVAIVFLPSLICVKGLVWLGESCGFPIYHGFYLVFDIPSAVQLLVCVMTGKGSMNLCSNEITKDCNVYHFDKVVERKRISEFPCDSLNFFSMFDCVLYFGESVVHSIGIITL